MIVLDSSILVAIIKFEEGATRLLDVLAAEDCVVGAPTLVETRLWCVTNLPERSSFWLEGLVEGPGVSIIPFGREMADAASDAFAKFGKASGHPAKLNFGDCMAYAISAALRAPLLFKGNDFGHTDVMAHPASIRTESA
jgi:ribonuclease VapC